MDGLEFTWVSWVLVFAAALAAGFVNAIAGGGTLISFPMLTFLGVPAIPANATNTVAVSPGHLGATWAQRQNLMGQRERLLLLVPIGIIGGVLGSILLLSTPENLFRTLIPWLILVASLLLAVQEPVRRWVLRRSKEGEAHRLSPWVTVPVFFLTAVYGGYFGAGMGVITLAILGLMIDESLTRLNALKQAFSFVVNTASAIFFAFSGVVIWPIAIVMAFGALAGGWMGGKFATSIKPSTLRMVVVVAGLLISLIYFIR